DTPGILWPRFQDEETGYNLAITGAIRDEILPVEDVACRLIAKLLNGDGREALAQKYDLSPEDAETLPGEILGKIALRCGLLKKGGLPDTTKAALTLIRDYRNLKLGKIILDALPCPSSTENKPRGYTQ
ncbi:MAG: hypothetical protein LBQ96_05310, partial [Fusobacteriaceae bacterium]|nr:hypothetical protein [Fusobacteriaceae bacterium]